MISAHLPGKGEVHGWHTDLAVDAKELESCAALLSPDERKRRNALHFDRDRRRFTVARSFLRRLLAKYLSLSPEAIVFQFSSYGKPYLQSGALHFNLSHSHEVAVCVVAPFEVGVDVERFRFIEDALACAAAWCSPFELESLQKYPPADLSSALLRGWTRKEALVKATGMGLTLPLRNFSVSLDPHRADLLHWENPIGENRRWFLQDLPVIEGYVGALASEEKVTGVERFHLPSGRMI